MDKRFKDELIEDDEEDEDEHEDDPNYRYYDHHALPEEWVMEPAGHPRLLLYLFTLLEWKWWSRRNLYKGLKLSVAAQPEQYLLTPDIALFDWGNDRYLDSWCIGETGPAPYVVFEIADEETWRKDVREKPTLYGQLGVEEYFVYDLHTSSVRQANPQRLFGWRLDKEKGEMQEIPSGSDGRLWSEHLESFLVPMGEFLRLYDRDGQMHLTPRQTHAAEDKARKARLAEELRALGMDPDQL